MGATVVLTEEAIEGGIRFHVCTGDRSTTLMYEWGGANLPSAESSKMAAAAVALLPLALRSGGAELVVDGPLSRDLAGSLQEWIDAWAFIRPDIYSKATLTVEDLTDEPVLDERPYSAALAFSGGVDSLYTALRHTESGSSRKPALVLAHGFDIPLDDSRGFATALSSAERSAAALGLEVSWVRTNWRRDFSEFWTMEFAAGIASVLHLWRDDAEQALLGSDDGSGYSFKVFPWSSNPATNPLLGSAHFPLRTQGFAADRVDKCNLVAQRPELLGTLRVCLREEYGGTNCGTCEKCIRTMLCFAAAGHRDVPALGGASTDALRSLRLYKRSSLAHFRTPLDHEPSHLSPAERSEIERFMRRENLRLGARVLAQPKRAATKLVSRLRGS